LCGTGLYGAFRVHYFENIDQPGHIEQPVHICLVIGICVKDNQFPGVFLHNGVVAYKRAKPKAVDEIGMTEINDYFRPFGIIANHIELFFEFRRFPIYNSSADFETGMRGYGAFFHEHAHGELLYSAFRTLFLAGFELLLYYNTRDRQ